jgi:hypothetical protein
MTKTPTDSAASKTPLNNDSLNRNSRLAVLATAIRPIVDKYLRELRAKNGF